MCSVHGCPVRLLTAIQVAMKRSVTLNRALQFLESKHLLAKTAQESLKESIAFKALLLDSDKELLLSWAESVD